jgi:Caspase domain/TIR domain
VPSTDATNATEAMADAYALIVGIAGYQRVTRLPDAVRNDAQGVRDLLVDPRYCGYRPGHVTLLLDGEATREAIIGALSQLAACAGPASSVLIYLSGHGGRVVSGAFAGEYLFPVDTVLASEETLARTAISGDELTAALRAIPARKMLVVFDCCHAGGLAQPKGANEAKGATTASETVKAGLPDGYYERLASGRGRAILSSSRDTESSYVLPGAPNSLFTQHLLAGLQGGAASADGLIGVFDLFEYVQPRVTRDQPGQHPVFKADLEQNFPVGLYLGGRKDAPIGQAEEFRYDAYLSYADREPDSTWVWRTLIPRLEREALRVVVSGAAAEPGVPMVVNSERGIQQAKRTLILLSPAYLEDTMADFENVAAQSLGIEEGSYRLLPVKIGPVDATRLPLRLRMLTALDLTDPRRADREFTRLAQALRSPLPRR